MAKGRVVGVNNPHDDRVYLFFLKLLIKRLSYADLQQEISESSDPLKLLEQKFVELDVDFPGEMEVKLLCDCIEKDDLTKILQSGYYGRVRFPEYDENGDYQYSCGTFHSNPSFSQEGENKEKNLYVDCCATVYTMDEKKNPYIKIEKPCGETGECCDSTRDCIDC